MEVLQSLTQAVKEEKLEYSQLTLARYLLEQYPKSTEEELWLAILVNRELAAGHVCLPRQQLKTRAAEFIPGMFEADQQVEQMLQTAELIGSAIQQKPIVLDNDRFYLARYHAQECRLARRLLQWSGQGQDIDPRLLEWIERLFADSALIDYQKLAALISLRHPLGIISGGPGTGKTWTVSNILLLLLQQWQLKGQTPGRILMAAPTGKAAARMTQSIVQNRERLAGISTLARQIPQQAVTLHRLLGMHRYTHQPRYHAANTLNCDVLVLDEASMIDQQMMAAVVDALPLQACLVLLGDKDQLSSVEAGSVFADLCGDSPESAFSLQQCEWLKQRLGDELPHYQGKYRLNDQLVILQHSRRFSSDSSIGRLASRVNRGDAQGALQQLMELNNDDSLSWQQLPAETLAAECRKQATACYRKMMLAEDVSEAFQHFHAFQVLAAVWDGPSGVNTINSAIDSEIKRQQGIAADTVFYQGLPLMMNANLYQYGIHNGDIGIVWPDQDGQLNVCFEGDGIEHRRLSLAQLPLYHLAYAMTIHKSQGSEFKQVLLVLPEYESSVCTRELLYTGLTRAVDRLEIWATASVLERTIQQKTKRSSGLLHRLCEQ